MKRLTVFTLIFALAFSVASIIPLNIDISGSDSKVAPAIKLAHNHAIAKAVQKESTVCITKTGKKYHRSNCSYLRKSKIATKLSQAKRSGYTPCSRCNPPR